MSPTNRTQSTTQDNESTFSALSKFADTFLNIIELERKTSILEFNQSGLTHEEFNASHYRDTGEPFAYIENGEMKVMSIIKINNIFRNKRIPPEDALKLYQKNLSLKEIAASLKRSEKWVRKSLGKFGIQFDQMGTRFNPHDIPYGWKEVNGKLKENEQEQWLLSKIESDLRIGHSSEKIAQHLNALKIQSRIGDQWIEPMISRVVTRNKKLKELLRDLV